MEARKEGRKVEDFFIRVRVGWILIRLCVYVNTFLFAGGCITQVGLP